MVISTFGLLHHNTTFFHAGQSLEFASTLTPKVSTVSQAAEACILNTHSKTQTLQMLNIHLVFTSKVKLIHERLLYPHSVISVGQCCSLVPSINSKR